MRLLLDFSSCQGLFEHWQNAGLEQISSLNKAIWRRNPEGFQAKSTLSQLEKIHQDGDLTFFEQPLGLVLRKGK